MRNLPYQLARRINPRQALLVLAGGIGLFALLGLVQAQSASWTLQAFDLRDSDLDRSLSMPATATSLLLACAAALAWSVSEVDKRTRERRWKRTGWVLAALALEEALGLHTWLEAKGVAWSACYLPLLAIAAIAWFDSLHMLAHQPRTQALFGAGIVTWLLAGALDAALSFGGIEILEMSAAALFSVALLARCRYLARAYHPIDEEESRQSLAGLAGDAIRRIDFRAVAVVVGAVTAAFAIQYGILHSGDYRGAESLAILDMNNEQTLWAMFQGSLIWAAGCLALLGGSLRVAARESRRWWMLLALVLLVLGSDEVIAIHDRFQDASGLPGQIILTPVAIAGIVAWWKILQQLSENRVARALFIAGAAVWFASQGIDVFVQGSYRWTIVPEEIGETTGSTLWAFSLLTWLRDKLESASELELQALADADPVPAGVTG